MKLKDRVAIVTGSGSGIGRAIALAMVREGARIAVVDLNEVGAQETVKEIQKEGGQAHPYRADVTHRAQIEAMVADVVKRWGAVHILVNNAGWDKVEPFIKSTEETWDKVLGINLKGPIICTRAVLDEMIKNGYGKIVSIASDAGRVGSTGEAVYSAAKGGIVAFTKTIAREVARHRINVNCVCPGPTDTPLFATVAAENPKLSESLKRVIPWGRLGLPEDVAPVVVFLASDDAGFITGQTLSVSGGLTMS
ncbi:MAG: 3-oxoacyl-ACP reductase FabG [Candidatus Rokubacteria bacterium]|nr:3-oxoacyl-ACP reductase FabG [Candidatus Rokubacteria bacterium]